MSLKSVGIFLLGAAVGIAASWKFAQHKWQAWAEEDIESVKKAYANKLNKELNTTKVGKTGVKMEESLSGVVEDLGYATSSPIPNDVGKKAKPAEKKPTVNYNEITEVSKRELNDVPYIIHDNLFGSEKDYEQINLRYDINMADGERTLYDEISNQEEDELKILGEDIIEYIDNRAEFEPSDDGEEESCVVHVRDDILKIDYEIDIHRW